MIKTTIIGYGDSLTKAINLGDKWTYIDRLEKYLPTYYPGISWNICNEGIPGCTTREALKKLDKTIFTHHPNIVFMMFGSNDSSLEEVMFRSLEEFENNLIDIVKKVKHHNNRTGLNGCIPIVVFITPPPVKEAVTAPNRNNNRLKQYTYVIKTVAKQWDCPIVDLFEAMIKEDDYSCMLCEDGVHLNEKGYDFLYDMTFCELTKLINYQGVLKDRDVDVEEYD